MVLSASSPVQSATPVEENRSNSIRIATWLLLGVTVAVFIARQVMKTAVFRPVTVDDFLIVAATIFAIGFFITVSILATEGLGIRAPTTDERLEMLMKGYYASEFLYISSICFSKLSLLVLFHAIVARQRTHRRLVLGFGFFIVIWSMASIVAVALQCQIPRPWEMMTLRCFNTRAFWIVYCIVDMSTEVCIIMLSFNLIVYLHISFSRKVAVITCFVPRILVAAVSLIRLVWLYPVTPHNNPEFRLWLPAILSEIHVCLGICTACIPYMAPVFKGLEGSLRRTYFSKSPNFELDDRKTRTPSSLWFCRQREAEFSGSWESTALSTLQYERTPQALPQIPTPRPMSPLTTPRYISRPSTANSKTPSQRGLYIDIPDRNSPAIRAITVSGPQTASSCALSPSCTFPVPLLSIQSFISTRNEPKPPSKVHSRNCQRVSSYSSRNLSPATPRRSQRFSLFPQQQKPYRRWSPALRHSGFTPVSVPLIRNLRSSPSSGVVRQPTQHGYLVSLDQSITLTVPPKLSIAPCPTSPPSTTKSPTSNGLDFSVEELNSPMGTAINNYFRSADTKNIPPALVPGAAPSNDYLQRNNQVLWPSNALRTQKASTRSQSLDALTRGALRNELRSHRDSAIIGQSLRSPGMPPVQDVRRSPRVVECGL
ncbi:hypothetical protein BDU57DRAFT_77020 [Ampelomyces quisqualis]|uniref:Rhodopsin domain-containing protein n=1 Tax=Ampelomyces quisqualis TaxID=50730 RepID=A0A6A5QBZ9_AMPQU|nr:hypothetical protein BDU57DRAFT_77020 [Ampelomyces quisqualis]